LTGLPLVTDPAADAAATEAGVVFNFNLQNPLTVEQALNIITKAAGEGVAWTIRHDAVLVTTKTKARGDLVIYNHDVQDLVFGLTDFTGPRIDRLRLLDDMKDDDGGGPFGGVGESPSPIDVAALKALIQENVEPGSWEQEGVRIDEGEGHILVVHTPEVQAKVRDFLNDLRRFNSSLVTIDSKFMTVASNWIQEIGVDFRGLDNPQTPFTDLDNITNGGEDNASRGLDNGGTGSTGSNASGPPSAGFFYDDGNDGDFKGHTENFFEQGLGKALSNIGGMTVQYTFLNDLQVSAILRAVEKTTDFTLVNDQVLSVHNTQRAYVSVINQQAYIQDFDVEVAQLEAVADPQINILTEGVVLDVRPTILYDRKNLRLEIQPTVAKVVALRPFATSLGSSTSPVEFQLPELEVQSVFTTAVIPDGGSILLGGLSNVRNIQRKAEVPWLAKIPIVGFFFKQEGYDDENKTLMILIKAHITDVRDELAKIEKGR
jgi:type II secretory pathway component GspD/PulD (secretin)